jgi:hypothetical protein
MGKNKSKKNDQSEREKAIRKELKRRIRDELTSGNVPLEATEPEGKRPKTNAKGYNDPVRRETIPTAVTFSDMERGPLTPESIIEAADRVLADKNASAGAARSAEVAKAKAVKALDAAIVDKREKRAVPNPATVDRDDENAVREYNEALAAGGVGGNFLTSLAERAARDKLIEADYVAAEIAPVQVAEEVDTDKGREFQVGATVFGKPSASGPEIEMNGNGQYKILLPDSDKMRGYTRVTTFIDGLEFTGALNEWKERQLAEGIALDAFESGPEPTGDLLPAFRDAMHVRDVATKKLEKADRRNELERGEYDDRSKLIAKTFKSAVAPLLATAHELAGTKAKATKGTEIHALCELFDAEGWSAVKQRRDAGEITDADVDDVRAYANAVEAIGMKVLESEVVVVNDTLGVAGRADRVYMVKLPGMARAVRVIGDLKTGSLYSPGKMAQQLALYAGAQRYNLETGERAKLGVSQDKGLIIHLPAGSGECHVYVADLALGRKGNALSGQVRAWRNEGKLGLDMSADLAAPAVTS